jgi:hypothetical protein
VAFEHDRSTLSKSGYSVSIEMNQPGFIRAIISLGREHTKIEWAHDSAWRFLPVVNDAEYGFLLHPIDLAINKVLALVGRDEARDYLDTLYCHTHTLSLGSLCRAAVGKDPGFSPRSLVDLIKRRGHYRAEDFSRLLLKAPVNLQELKIDWLAALEQAEAFINEKPMNEAGCLYYSPSQQRFIGKVDDDFELFKDCVPHYGTLGGVLPKFIQDH